MRTVERFAFLFGILNLLLGVMSFLTPFVSQHRRGISRLLPRRSQGLINRRPGRLFNLFAVNPPHAAVHSALGAAGLATRPLNNFSRAYMWLNAVVFGAMAVMGWAKVGFRSGIHSVMGLDVDTRDNILHTVWAAAALLLALRPNLGRRTSSIDRGMDLTSAGLMD